MRWLKHIFAMALLMLSSTAGMADAPQDVLKWTKLPNLPDKEGFASMFAGVHNGALIVAGGANFPDKKPWEGGTKVWYDTVYALEKPNGEWKTIGKLPMPLGYGVSISTKEGIICIGGSDANGHHAEVFRLEWVSGELKTMTLPALPKPCANMSGALLKNTIYVAGGIETPGSTEALKTLWALDLTKIEAGWQELEPLPGTGRMLATAGVQDGSFFLFSGAGLKADAEGKPAREWLLDAYRYTPGKGWKRIADLPRISVAAPSPAPAIGQSHLLVMGGDDGEQVSVTPEEHKGFPRDILAYHTITDTWTTRGEVPFSKVTVPVAEWNGQFVVISGERQPGIRSPEVWSGEVIQRKASFGAVNYATLVGYLGAMVGIGWFCSRKNKNTDDYFKASGRIPWWAAGLSIYATMLSSLTFMSIPAKAYASDWVFAWANFPILLVVPIIIAFYLPFFRQLNITSAYEYLERRFNLATRMYGSVAFILFQIGRQAIVLLLPSLALATVSDLNVQTCIILMGVLCVAYTVMGGIEAVVWTDVVQTVVLLGAAIVSLCLIIFGSDGGVSGFMSTATDHNKFHMFNLGLDPRTTKDTFWAIIVAYAFINLVPYTSDQAVVQRYMTTSDEKAAARSIWANALLAIPSTAIFFAIGTALFVYFRAHPDKLDPAQATDAIFPAFIMQNLPMGVAGLVIAGVFAAAQSTVSGSLNSVVTAIMTDFYKRFGGKSNEAGELRLARILTAAFGVFATLAALVLSQSNTKSLWDAYNGLIGLAGSGLGGLFALGIFTKRAHGVGAMIGAISSAVVLYLVQQHTKLPFYWYAAVGIITCFVVGWVASLVIPCPVKPLEGLTRHTVKAA
jgi:solute:Na+ symporter, SSS family